MPSVAKTMRQKVYKLCHITLTVLSFWTSVIRVLSNLVVMINLCSTFADSSFTRSKIRVMTQHVSLNTCP